MCTHTHTHTHTNRSFQPILLILVAAIFFSACKKENITDDNSNQPQTMSATMNNQLNADIESYYDLMHDLHNGGQSTTTFSVDSFVFYTEAVYNYKSVKLNYNNEPYLFKLEIEIPIYQNKIAALVASNVFYTIKDSIMSSYSKLNNVQDYLAHFDLSIVSLDENVLKLKAIYTIPELNTSYRELDYDCDDMTLSGPNSAAYSSQGAYPDIYGNVIYPKGKGIINYSTHTFTSTRPNHPGAAFLIRLFGLRQYTGVANCENNFCVFATDIETIYSVYDEGMYNLPSIVGLPNSQYKDLGITSFEDNEDIWSAVFLYDFDYSTTPNDPQIAYKENTTRPMVNFYANRVPLHIEENKPTGKYLYDFHIWYTDCLCMKFPAYGKYGFRYRHNYQISYGIPYARNCEELIELPFL